VESKNAKRTTIHIEKQNKDQEKNPKPEN